MSNFNNRWPEVGDLLTCQSSDETYTGLVYKIEPRHSGFGGGRVLVEWTGSEPYDYNSQYGYSPVNIHNQHSVFSLIKARRN